MSYQATNTGLYYLPTYELPSNKHWTLLFTNIGNMGCQATSTGLYYLLTYELPSNKHWSLLFTNI